MGNTYVGCPAFKESVEEMLLLLSQIFATMHIWIEAHRGRQCMRGQAKKQHSSRPSRIEETTNAGMFRYA